MGKKLALIIAAFMLLIVGVFAGVKCGTGNRPVMLWRRQV